MELMLFAVFRSLVPLGRVEGHREILALYVHARQINLTKVLHMLKVPTHCHRAAVVHLLKTFDPVVIGTGHMILFLVFVLFAVRRDNGQHPVFNERQHLSVFWRCLSLGSAMQLCQQAAI